VAIIRGMRRVERLAYRTPGGAVATEHQVVLDGEIQAGLREEPLGGEYGGEAATIRKSLEIHVCARTPNPYRATGRPRIPDSSKAPACPVKKARQRSNLPTRRCSLLQPSIALIVQNVLPPNQVFWPSLPCPGHRGTADNFRIVFLWNSSICKLYTYIPYRRINAIIQGRECWQILSGYLLCAYVFVGGLWESILGWITIALPHPAVTRSRVHGAGHRARSHNSAHADATLDAVAVEDHPLVPKGAAELVADNAALAALIAHLREAGQFAYDSEFIGELTYFPKLCLIQVASSTRIGLIDPLAKMDLKPFWELLADPAVEKIVHAGQQDIEPVSRNLGQAASNFFDTQVAAGLAGLPYPLSLSKLVAATTGAKLGKGLTFTHWDQRPLSDVQLRYAADDVRYLPRVRAELGDRLERLGHFAWAKQECESLCDTTLFRFDPRTQYLRVRGRRRFSREIWPCCAS